MNWSQKKIANYKPRPLEGTREETKEERVHRYKKELMEAYNTFIRFFRQITIRPIKTVKIDLKKELSLANHPFYQL